MTDWLRAILAALPLPHITVVRGDYITGDVVYGADDECGCEVDPDAGQPVLVVLPIETAQELFAEAIRRSDNGALADDVAWEMARSLELGGEVA